jgi:hypothetical protein
MKQQISNIVTQGGQFRRLFQQGFCFDKIPTADTFLRRFFQSVRIHKNPIFLVQIGEFGKR